MQPRASVRFPIFGTAGTSDFNAIEMRLLDRALKTPHRVVFFEGGHTLPLRDVAMQAISWLEWQAMASGLRMKDEAFIDGTWAEHERTAVAAGETAAAVHLLRAMADDFRGLRHVEAIEARAHDLASRKDVRRILDREREDDEKKARQLRLQ